MLQKKPLLHSANFSNLSTRLAQRLLIQF